MKRKQSNSDGSDWWTETELEIAQLILVLRRGCLLSRIPFTWGLKRKRSAIQDDTPSPPSSQKHHGGAVVVASSCKAEIQAVVKEEALSPTTPLSFPTPESDEKTKPSSPRKAKTSLKKKRENYLQVIEDLTKTKDSLNQEIENVKRHRNQLKAFNLNLKAREQEVLTATNLNNGPKSECRNPSLEIGQAVQLGQSNGSVKSSKSTAENEKQKQQLQQMQMQMQMQMANQNQNFGTSNGEGVVQFLNVSDHQTTSLPMVSSSSSSVLGGNRRDVENNRGPLLLPDLNLSVEELTNVDTCQPLDENATNKDLNRAMAAQARQRRLQIFRLKKPMGNNSKPHQFHR